MGADARRGIGSHETEMLKQRKLLAIPYPGTNVTM